ncbi:MAG TPA: N-acetylornithine carbamoyltransferase [Holophagaceae bacterium]|nr:N-acetylornithine carbamoyltransferase [Holophagaceae bacterium]
MTTLTATQHITHLKDLGPEGVARVLAQAAAWKQAPPEKIFADKLLAMVFFNPSLRTRASFEAAMLRHGGHAIVLEVGNGAWKLESREGVVMDGDKAEHIKEAVPVLARYADALAVRTFSGGVSDSEDELDPVIAAFRAHSPVPVISMESAREHPCQGLADLLTVQEAFGTAKVPVTLTWAPHMKPLPKAVPNSFLLTAAACGADITVAHPEGYELAPEVRAEAEAYAKATGGSVRFTHDQAAALKGAKAVCAKAWGPATGAPAAPMPSLGSWMPTQAHLGRAAEDAIFLHCLPVRRNLEVADGVLDGPWSRVVDEAENRFHIQRALLASLL